MRGLRVHLLALSDGQGLSFKIGFSQPLATTSRRHRSCPQQPFLQDANTSKAPLVQKFPVAHQVWPVLKGKLLLERADDIDKGLAIFRIFGTVACKVNVHASSAELAIQISEREQVVGTKQHMHRFRLVGDRFDHVQLIEKAAADGILPRCWASSIMTATGLR